MTQQVINVGTVANDGTGDPLRTAFIKVNANFAEVYTLLPTDTGGNPIPISPINSPHFTGDPQTATTPPAGDADSSIPNTAWVDLYFSKKDSPIFTGDPRSNATLTPADADTSLATTGWVKSLLTAPDLSGFAPIASPHFTGIPTAPTAAAATNTDQLATTAFVAAAIISGGSTTPGGGTPTPPPTPIPGQFWYDLTTGILSIWVIDASGPPGQWVAINSLIAT
jgi:hypothetical protein